MISMAENMDCINQHIDLRKLEGAPEAGFGLFSDCDKVKCLPGIRAELL
jgi:hypothetical protein